MPFSGPKFLRLAFVLCVALVFGALVRLSSTLLSLETKKQTERQHYEREHNIRIALWNLDAEISKWIAAENNRPYFDYQAFFAPQRPYNRMLGAPHPDELLRPSPFLEEKNPVVRIRFLITPDGTFTSPEAPDEALVQFAGYTKPLPENGRLIHVLRASFRANDFIDAAFLAPREAQLRNTQTQAQNASPFEITPDDAAHQTAEEQTARAGTFGTADNLGKIAGFTPVTPAGDELNSREFLVLGEPAPFYPILLNGELFLLRTLDTDQGTTVQGIWADRPTLEARLKEIIAARLPNASFRAAASPFDAASPSVRRTNLATLPLTLKPGSIKTVVPPALFSAPLHSQERITLLASWAGAIIALTGIGILLNATIALSERRATFVSAVTHELRTPLTTFQLYTEMLADGMVPPESQKSYLHTLHAEAARLTHLVENVLGFARLEKGRALRRDETLTVGEIAQRVANRINTRLVDAGLQFEMQKNDTEIDAVSLRTDGTAVEQILFNLADNAAKYAGTGRTVRLAIDQDTDGENIRFNFADNGSGIAPSARKKLFQTFNRSSEEAAGKKPGVGLGLAFSRQLARRLGGNLKLVKTDASGTVFLLTLPVN